MDACGMLGGFRTELTSCQRKCWTASDRKAQTSFCTRSSRPSVQDLSKNRGCPSIRFPSLQSRGTICEQFVRTSSEGASSRPQTRKCTCGWTCCAGPEWHRTRNPPKFTAHCFLVALTRGVVHTLLKPNVQPDSMELLRDGYLAWIVEVKEGAFGRMTFLTGWIPTNGSARPATSFALSTRTLSTMPTGRISERSTRPTGLPKWWSTRFWTKNGATNLSLRTFRVAGTGADGRCWHSGSNVRVGHVPVSLCKTDSGKPGCARAAARPKV